MKSILLIASFLVSVSVFASAKPVTPDEAFAMSKDVSESIAELQANGYTEKSEPNTLLLSGSCGFAGCDSTYLVGVTLSTKGANTQSTSVVAIVRMPAIGQYNVKLAEIK